MTAPIHRSATTEQLIADAQAVVDAVTMDDSGMMVGTIWQGGNGGLLSRETLKAVDRLRLTIAKMTAASEAKIVERTDE